jgi:hypothetical protein
MSLHINRFIDRVQGLDLRTNQILTMTTTEARDLVSDLARLLLELNTVRSNAVNNHNEETITIQMDGGSY